MRTTYLVCYDIADDKRLRKVFKTCGNFGDHLQFSVFECDLNPSEKVELETTLGEIINKKDGNNCILSHLALGEAYGNSFKKGEEVFDGFIKLIGQLKPFTNIVNHDGIESVLRDLLEEKEIRIEAADAIHVATAIKNRCEVLRTIDKGLYDIPHKKVKALGERYGLDFSISKMEG